MTAPEVPLRMELTVELPGTPDQVWEAIATANGVTAWFVPTDLEERNGGAVCFHMGETESPGTITHWEPPARIAYEEPDWAALAGHEGQTVTPLATEMLVEAKSGGTCVVRIVTSAFGTGAEWEREFFDDMEQGWLPFFDHLRLYLTRFPGQTVTPLTVDANLAGPSKAVIQAMRESLSFDAKGEPFASRGLSGQVLDDGDDRLLVMLDAPVPGYIAFLTFGVEDDKTMAQVAGYLFSPDAAAYVERERSGWHDWLESLPVAAS